MTVVRVMVVGEAGLGDERVRSIKRPSGKWMTLLYLVNLVLREPGKGLGESVKFKADRVGL